MDGCWEQLTFPEPVELPAPTTHAERVAAGRGARRLLAKVLYQALVDEGLAAEGALPDKYWPWDGQWTPRAELDTWWQSDWFESVCEWLDMDSDDVVELVERIRDGKHSLETDKRRATAAI